MILDGFGLNENHVANAVYEANSPNIDQLMKDYPFVKGYASGMDVGLPDGQMGNSEVGHLNIGAGRIVYQELTRVTKDILDGGFYSNEAFLTAVNKAKENNSNLHLWDFYQMVAFIVTTSIYMLLLSLQNVKILIASLFIVCLMVVILLQCQVKGLFKNYRINWTKLV